MIDRQEFREDLYYRLNGLALRLPALRERADLEAVARRILQAERPQDTPALSPRVLDLFRRYRWPGNIRQLANVLRTAAVMSAGEHEITSAHLSDDFLEDAQRAVTTAAPPAMPGPAYQPPFTVETTPGSACAIATPPADVAVRTHRGVVPAEPAPTHTLEQVEIEMIRNVLEAVNGNISAASKQLGISRNTIYRKLRWNVTDGTT
jgi:transcriptional regulator of acetoin/glycerol metabolism